MFTTKELITAILLPGIVACALALAAWRPWSKHVNRPSWGAAMGSAGAFWLGMWLTMGPAQFPPLETFDWYLLAPGLVLVWAAADSIFKLPVFVRYAITFIVTLVTVWMIGHTIFPANDRWLLIAVVSLGIAGVWAGTDILATRRPGPGLPLTFVMIAAGAVIVTMDSNSINIGKTALSLPATLGGIWMASLWAKEGRLDRGALASAVMLLSLLLIMGQQLGDVPIYRAILLAVAPLAAWVAEIRPIASKGIWIRLAVRMGAVAIPVACAAGPAALELYAQLREQLQGGGG